MVLERAAIEEDAGEVERCDKQRRAETGKSWTVSMLV